MFDLKKLRSMVGRNIYERGDEYYQSNRVKIQLNAHQLIKAKVYGSQTYDVTIKIKDNLLTASCTCPYYTSYHSYCKHIVATILQAEDNGSLAQKPIFNNWKLLLTNNIEQSGQGKPPTSKLIFKLSIRDYGWTIEPVLKYIRKDGLLGRNLTYNIYQLKHDSVLASDQEKMAAYSLHGIFQGSYSYNFFKFGERIGHILSFLKDSKIFEDKSNNFYKANEWVTFYPNKLDVRFVIKEKNKDYYMSLFLIDPQTNKSFEVNFSYQLLTSGTIYVYHNSVLYAVKQNIEADLLLPFFKNDFPVFIPKSEITQFMELVYPKLTATEAKMDLPSKLQFYELNQLIKKKLFLREEKGELRFNLSFYYSDESSNTTPLTIDALPFRPMEIKERDGKYFLIKRQAKVENVWKNILEENFLVPEDTEYQLQSGVDPYDWLFDSLPLLAQHGFEIYGEEKLKTLKIRRAIPRFISKVTSGIDWFDLEVEIDFDGLRISYFDIARTLKKQKKYIRLSDGSAVRLNDEILEKLGLISHFAETSPDKKAMRLSKTQTLLLDEILTGFSEVTTDQKFKEQLKKIKNFTKIKPVPLPKHFKGQLRPYQKAGLDWLSFLNEYGFGGCLADDMGLGKTIEALALLQREKEKLKKPLLSLIVAPTSVISNWNLEAKRFTPKLKVYVHNGAERTTDAEFLKNFDLIVTSYTLLWRDYHLFKKVAFHYLILDESQKIKNPFSLTAKTARNIKAVHRLVMTGTPIENNLLELWSQFQFLNAGMLGSVQSFTSYYSKSIEKEGNVPKAEQLRRLIYPFILRRTKENVAKELPAKTENIIFCEMDEAQRTAYHKWRDFYRTQILEAIQDKGFNRSKMKVLEGLTRLRQVSIHPRMVDESYRQSSGKFEVLWNILEEILSENHKVLLFSQFVKALSLTRKKLDQDKTPYLYLDGHTKNRQKIIDRFQNDESVKIFLISLKAGGLGLNLTAAEYVIHLDPWWNPAVENQATDRAHRIGQTKNVFVYKLITRESVEEKILALQEKKKKLAQELISTEAAFFKNLEKKDIEQLFS